MIYLVAILLPPVAILFKGKIFQAIFNGILWIASILLFVITLGGSTLLWIIAVIWAILTVKGANDQERHDEIVDAIRTRK